MEPLTARFKDLPPRASEIAGGKGASLADMTRAGLNVPPGFTISTECCDHFYRHDHRWPDDLEAELRAHLERLEKLAGRPATLSSSVVANMLSGRVISSSV